MIRGTTPTHVYSLPFDTDAIKSLEIVYKQKGEVKLKRCMTDCILDKNAVTVRLSQEETLSFSCNACVEIQIRVLTNEGEALASCIMRVRVDECLSDEVLV